MVNKKPTTIKLVANPDCERAKVFKELILRRSSLKLLGDIDVTTIDNADVNIFFDFNGFENNIEEMVKEIARLHETSLPILDIRYDRFKEEVISPYLVVAIVSAGFVTCIDSDMQEAIYENTGRLSAIVDWPLFGKEFEDPDTRSVKDEKELNILWFGLQSEMFSIRPYLAKNKYNINTFIDNKDRIWGVNDKVWQKVVDRADIVFLPKTFTHEDELVRLRKVEQCVRKGKFVCAPELRNDMDGVATDLDLEQAIAAYYEISDLSSWITETQNTLKRKYSPETAADQLVFALKEAPNDDFAKNLDYFLESEGVNL